MQSKNGVKMGGINRLSALVWVICAFFLLASCGGKEKGGYVGTVYPPTQTVQIDFHPDHVDDQCRVFAHALVDFPPNINNREIASLITDEAKKRGADVLLVGHSRISEDDLDFAVSYYGPVQSYRCKDNWCGWKFGFEHWEEQGEWVNLGYKEWNKTEIYHDYSIVMQTALLRCR